MLIPIKTYDDSHTDQGAVTEYSLIELNGNIYVEGEKNIENNLAGECIGNITMKGLGKPVMIIGAHKLEGEIQKLSKPFYILEKQDTIESQTTSEKNCDDMIIEYNNDSDEENNNYNNERDDVMEHDNSQGPGFHIIGMVKQKILFKSRPKPIVNKESATFIASNKGNKFEVMSP